MRNAYDDWLNADTGYTFAEWLGIERPKIEYGDNGYLMWSSRGVGQWRNTKKEAKATYKADMKSRKGERVPYSTQLMLRCSR